MIGSVDFANEVFELIVWAPKQVRREDICVGEYKNSGRKIRVDLSEGISHAHEIRPYSPSFSVRLKPQRIANANQPAPLMPRLSGIPRAESPVTPVTSVVPRAITSSRYYSRTWRVLSGY